MALVKMFLELMGKFFKIIFYIVYIAIAGSLFAASYSIFLTLMILLTVLFVFISFKKLKHIWNEFGENSKKLFLWFFPFLKPKETDKKEGDTTIHIPDENISAIITTVESKSDRVCKSCGSPFTEKMNAIIDSEDIDDLYCEFCGNEIKI